MADVEAATTDSAATDTVADSAMTNADRTTSNDSLREVPKQTKNPVKSSTLTASSVAARLAELVGVHADAFNFSMTANGQATITLTPELLAKLGLKS